MTLEKPVRRKRPGKLRRLAQAVEPAELMHMLENVSYEPSPYHCPTANGGRPKRRAKPASICQKNWTVPEAQEALRRAIQNQWISSVWDNGFPKHIWYQDGENIYEARHSSGRPGTYHAYPIDRTEAPLG